MSVCGTRTCACAPLAEQAVKTPENGKNRTDMEIKNDFHIELPEDVKTIIGKLEEGGYEAYAVGGCVRDSLLSRIPGDWDITTSARPEEIKARFRRTVDTGIEHGTVSVLMGSRSYEVTTYRIDGEYADLRHPKEVQFTTSLEEDLKRRDFTINAMAYNERTGLVDLFDGRGDLERHLVRCVGDPDERFDEDALRILRAVRFAAQLDFDIEKGTRDAISGHAANLAAVSKERILTEVTKLICSAHIEKTEDLQILGLAPYIAECFTAIDPGHIAELKAWAATEEAQEDRIFAAEASAWSRPVHADDAEEDEAAKDDNTPETSGTKPEADGDAPKGIEGVPMNNVFALFGLPAPAASGTKQETKSDKAADEMMAAYDLTSPVSTDRRYIRYAFLLQGLDRKTAQDLLRSLKADNVTVKQGSLLADMSMKPLPADRYGLKKILAAMKPELFRDLLFIKLASRGTGMYRQACESEDIRKVISTFEDIMETGEPVYINDLVLTGSDLISLGAAEGPEIGEILNRMLDAVQKDPQINTIMYLISNFYKINKK